jgi:hypothetical protein
VPPENSRSGRTGAGGYRGQVLGRGGLGGGGGLGGLAVAEDAGMGTHDSLTVTVWPQVGARPLRWTLTDDPPGGDHPDPVGACAALAAARHPFAPVPPGSMCAQVYGGPQTATIEGVWRGERVSARYSRTDGCEIARWNAVAAVLQPASQTPRPAGD